MNKTKLGLTGLIMLGAASTSGCNLTLQRAAFNDDTTPYKSSAEYLASVNHNETRLDAAETDREARCISDISAKGFAYKTQGALMTDLGKCVDYKRDLDKAKFIVASVLIDGTKLYGLINGLTGGKLNYSNNNTSTTSGPVTGAARTMGNAN